MWSGPQCPASPTLAQGNVWRGHQLQGGTLLRVDHWVTLAAVLPHSPSCTLDAVGYKYWSPKGLWGSIPPKDIWVQRGSPFPIRRWVGNPKQWTVPCLSMWGRPDLLRRTQPLACAAVHSLPEEPALMPRLGATCLLLSSGVGLPTRPGAPSWPLQ